MVLGWTTRGRAWQERAPVETEVGFPRSHPAGQGIRQDTRDSSRTLYVPRCFVSSCIVSGECRYAFIRNTGDQVGPLWPAVVKELRVMAGVLTLIRRSWRSPWSETVQCTDALEWGQGPSSWECVRPVEVP